MICELFKIQHSKFDSLLKKLTDFIYLSTQFLWMGKGRKSSKTHQIFEKARLKFEMARRNLKRHTKDLKNTPKI